MVSTPVIELRLPAAANIDPATSKSLHESVKRTEEYQRTFPKASFVKAEKITSKDFLAANPLIGRVKWKRSTFYVYQRHNRGNEFGEKLVAKKFSIRQSLAEQLEALAASRGCTQVQLLEEALLAFLPNVAS